MRSSGYIPSEQHYNGWSQNTKCPLKSHKSGSERSASFGYHFEHDRFYCFGCKQSGRAVEFLAGIKGVSKLVIAESILAKYDDDIELVEYLDHSEEIKERLFDFSIKCQKTIELLKDNPELLKKIDKILLFIDCYLFSSVPNNKLDSEELEERLLESLDFLKVIENI